MKIMNTSSIFDNSKQLISELYEARLGDMDITVPEIQRAVLELKLYHLPPLYDVPVKIRNRVALRPELALFHESELTVQNKNACPSCYAHKPLYGDNTVMCLECWSAFLHALWKDFPIRFTNFTQILNCTNYVPDNLRFIIHEPWIKSVEATTLKELLAASRTQLRQFPKISKQSVECWTTPKKAFMALEVGCIHCKKVPSWRDTGWLWSADFSDWSNGYCPMCIDLDPVHDTVWGMTDNEYRQWQDSYTATKKIQRTIARYGALALLLVSPSAHWANYVAKVVPHSTKPISLGDQIIMPKSLHQVNTKVKSLSDLNIDLDEIL